LRRKAVSRYVFRGRIEDGVSDEISDVSKTRVAKSGEGLVEWYLPG
jgi:hypothetical protein